MQANNIMLIVLLFYLLPFLAESSSITPKENSTVDGKTCEQMLEAFWKMKDANVEEEYQLTTTEKLHSKPVVLNEREQLMEYQREFC